MNLLPPNIFSSPVPTNTYGNGTYTVHGTVESTVGSITGSTMKNTVDNINVDDNNDRNSVLSVVSKADTTRTSISSINSDAYKSATQSPLPPLQQPHCEHEPHCEPDHREPEQQYVTFTQIVQNEINDCNQLQAQLNMLTVSSTSLLPSLLT